MTPQQFAVRNIYFLFFCIFNHWVTAISTQFMQSVVCAKHQSSTIDRLHDCLRPINNPTSTLFPHIWHHIFPGKPANRHLTSVKAWFNNEKTSVTTDKFLAQLAELLCLLTEADQNDVLCVSVWTLTRVAQIVGTDLLMIWTWSQTKNKSLANAKRPCGCSVLCLRPKSSLCSCPHGPHYGRIILFTGEFYRLTEQLFNSPSNSTAPVVKLIGKQSVINRVN